MLVGALSCFAGFISAEISRMQQFDMLDEMRYVFLLGAVLIIIAMIKSQEKKAESIDKTVQDSMRSEVTNI